MSSREQTKRPLTRNRPILIVDEDPQSRAHVAAILADADFEVLLAPTGDAGIELARMAHPAVILLDILVPGMDGIAILQNLKQEPGLKEIPVIGVSASPDLTCAEKAFRAGAQFFLPKPFRPGSLLSLVELAVDRALRESPMHRRRRHPRHPVQIAVACIVAQETEASREVPGETGDISLSGLLLLLSEGLPSGTDVQVRLELPDGPITAKAKVLWQALDPTGDGRFRHGIRLLGFTEGGALAQYRRYLAELSRYLG
jgi:CheY-like chemotaxis protein